MPLQLAALTERLSDPCIVAKLVLVTIAKLWATKSEQLPQDTAL